MDKPVQLGFLRRSNVSVKYDFSCLVGAGAATDQVEYVAKVRSATEHCREASRESERKGEILQIVVIVSSALNVAAISMGNLPNVVPVCLALVIAVASGLLALFKYERKSYEFLHVYNELTKALSTFHETSNFQSFRKTIEGITETLQTRLASNLR